MFYFRFWYTYGVYLQLFGQSECTGPHTVNVTGEWKIGTCGRPLLSTESMIAPDSKELCYRGFETESV